MKLNTFTAALFAGALTFSTGVAFAQEEVQEPVADNAQVAEVPSYDEPTGKKAWEIGLMGSMINWDRTTITDHNKVDGMHKFTLHIDKLMGGGGLYIARELSPWFYIDLQGTVNAFKRKDNDKYELAYMVGPGLQLRLGRLFKSHYIEPYLRVGINYLHRDFDIVRSGNWEEINSKTTGWTGKDNWNKELKVSDKKDAFPVSLGAGVLGWLSDRVGLGLQGEYLLPLQNDQPRFVQVTGRLAFRIGGDTKVRPEHVTKYVDRDVEQIREVETIVERYREDDQVRTICNLLEGVVFDFDQDVIKPESNDVLDRVAEIIKKEDASTARFLIVGYTDARGSVSYNKDLSLRRAKAVYDALVSRGVAEEMLAYRGVGKGAAVLPTSESHEAREGDRKVTIERVRNTGYWDSVKR